MGAEHISFSKYCFNKKEPLYYVLKFLFILFSLMILYNFDPFGLSSVTALHSKNIFYQWTTHQYNHDDRKEKKPVSVVILRDESFKGSWPVTAIVHAEILEEIKKLEPKAVFVDFAFIDDRKDKDETLELELISVINDYKSDKNNLYFLAIAPTDKLPKGILSSIEETRVKLVSGPTEDKKFPGLRYETNKKNKATAVAFKIYHDFYDKTLPVKDMEIVWGTYNNEPSDSDNLLCSNDLNSNKPTCGNGPYACIKQSEGVIPKIIQRFIHWLPDFVKTPLIQTFFPELPKHPFRQLCPPIPTIDASYFLSSSKIDLESKSLVKKLINNKIVFYGADLDAVNDLVYPPTHINIPGVYFNAMAMDNLINYGNNYLRHHVEENSRFKEIKTIFGLLLEFVGLIILLLLGEGFRQILNNQFQTQDNKFSYAIENKLITVTTCVVDLFIFICYLMVCFVFLTCIVCFGFYVLRTPPIDFLGLTVLIGIRSVPSWIRAYDRIENALKSSCGIYK